MNVVRWLASAALLCALGGAVRAEELRFEPLPSAPEFRHRSDRSAARRLPENIGAGVALGDFDGNGAADVVLVDGGRFGGNEAQPKLLLNDGKAEFRDGSGAWGIAQRGYGMGAAAGDFDNDGRLDLLLTAQGAADTLLRNVGGRFEDVTREAGLAASTGWSTSAGWFDLEGDGDLDLWIVQYLDYDPTKAVPCYYRGIPVYCTPQLESGARDRLYRNRGDGTFEEISAQLTTQPPGKGLAIALGDIDLDGDLDAYVANDTTANQLWINERGRFQEIGLLAGVALSEAGEELAGMGADLSDVDGDGDWDLGSTNFQDETTAIYLQLRDQLFREASDSLGVGSTARRRLSWGMDFFDADNDGDEDLLVASGHIYDNLSEFSDAVGYEQLNTLYENRGGKFVDVTAGAGPALQEAAVSRGLATGDLDGDGALDYVINNLDGTAQFALNRTSGRGHFVSLWLEGTSSNRSAHGARVEATLADGRKLVRQVVPSSSYQSMNDPRVHLGLGAQTEVKQLVVFWPGGERQVIGSVAGDRFYRLRQGGKPAAYEPGKFGGD